MLIEIFFTFYIIFQVLKAVMSVTSHEQYFSYLGKLLDDTKKKTKLAKQFERVLIAIMDAFHFDLSLACPENGNSNAGDKSLSQDLPIENGTYIKQKLFHSNLKFCL